MRVKFLYLIVFFALFSCSKENDQQNEMKIDAKVYEKYQEASNPDNPWEHFGLIHNDILDEYKLEKIKDLKKNPQMFAKKVNRMDEVIEFAFQKFDEKYQVLGLEETSSVEQIKHILNDGDNFYANIVDEYTKEKANVHVAVKDFFKIIETFSGQNITYTDVKDEIIKFEKGILLGNYSLNKAEKDYILKMTSIARHSFYFWSNQKPRISKTGRPWWKWVIVGLADVAGALTGKVKDALGASAGASTLIDWIAPDNVIELEPETLELIDEPQYP